MLSLGQDGWSAVISAEFTFDNVRAAARQLAATLKANDALVVGYDSRFLADKFAGEIVKIMTAAGIGCYLPERDLPLPVFLWEVGDRGATGGLMVTGGGLAADFCGLKYVQGRGTGGRKPGVENFEPRTRYLNYLEKLVDAATIKNAKLKIVVDPMYGAGRGYLDRLLQQVGCAVEEIRNYRDVLFGGSAPDPLEANLSELKAKMVENQADLGFALSGDAGDFAVVDRAGRYWPSEKFAEFKTGGALIACLRIAEQAARKGLKTLS